MKRIISCFIAMAMIAALSVPAFAGQENADNLETVILKVRGKIDVPQSYDEFNSNMRTDEYGVTHWSMQWSQKNEEESWNTSYISVEVTSDGFIESYNKYGGDERYSEYVKIPAVQKIRPTSWLNPLFQRYVPK